MLTHILVPLSNPHINICFCYRLDGLFFLFALKGQHVLTSHRALPKVVPKSPGKQQRPLRASAAADVAVSQETGKRNKNITPGDWPGGNPPGACTARAACSPSATSPSGSSSALIGFVPTARSSPELKCVLLWSCDRENICLRGSWACCRQRAHLGKGRSSPQLQSRRTLGVCSKEVLLWVPPSTAVFGVAPCPPQPLGEDGCSPSGAAWTPGSPGPSTAPGLQG